MNIQAKKLNIIEKFVKLDDEFIIDKVNELLTNKNFYEKEYLDQIYLKDFYETINNAEKDSRKNKVKDINELRKEVERWN